MAFHVWMLTYRDTNLPNHMGTYESYQLAHEAAVNDALIWHNVVELTWKKDENAPGSAAGWFKPEDEPENSIRKIIYKITRVPVTQAYDEMEPVA
jgi:hypothetical protein